MDNNLNRRDVLAKAGFLALATSTAVAGTAFGAGKQAGKHAMHMSAKHRKLIALARDCSSKASACLCHCLENFDDNSLQECAKIVAQVESVCDALEKAAVFDSTRLKQMASVAIRFCEDCKKECQKHEKHPPCKACAQSCVACADECKKIAA